MKTKRWRIVVTYIIFIFVAFCFILCASATTSPLYPHYKGWDSGLFQVIGKGWSQGYIPYKQLYDQKGPALFFIEMLGYLITGNRYGVFLIQVLFMFVSILAIFKILSRSFKEVFAAILSICVIIVFACNYEFGNLCEEYANPFLIICLYFVSEWLDKKTKKKPDHNPMWALFYGITFGFCFMSRLTNSIAVCMAVFFIIIYLVKNGAWVSLIKNAIAFICGTALVTIPFVLYFAIKGCSYEFWYGTLLYNISYASNSNGGISTIIKGAMGQIGSYAIIAAGFILIIKKEYYEGLMYIALGLGTEFLLMNIMNFGHYAMITFPLLPLAIYELKKTYDKSDDYSGGKVFRYIVLIILIGTCSIALIRTGKEAIKLKKYYDRFSVSSSEDAIASYKQLLDFVEKIPENERDQVVGYGTNPWFYLDMDITPANRFFVMQDWQAEFSESFREYLLKEYNENKPSWIVYSDSKTPVIKNILDNYYEVVDSEPVINTEDGSELILYHLVNH
ncbi:glycosyltransferase family 39 protein [Butyrivibrio sp. LC3010]|uniref:glycosyltransferase family 39 protein n=1 Tax=Butyrivibrio sp. LC3010 TaxID=1280680 RepID=UPI000405FAAE|nr:glycosyltransferase family 39 protein [Butyrivibrio sp. LC3010]